ncbi:assimilatory sulfite reductase (NADPH) flavoprotein subunit [Paenibacillus sp. UMB4589-SE434]|uniref:assimilatory sulfite reductase (NADPH) flavoprotein subunit n=1 Tax=Paenibacillus sp. UMB4589-SE434 TaxID=3046314 RepID=UPI00254FB4F2|nr:assimilatory sulfite reductase (NADPH) flavoprotein subunit [Paenibacillus sp. UMB4589-SE434]MDK8182380.1 assimilatory sulfite reductase (NADPH) flavoprotein subunit [Paenibacillus sp. UMB4589-SE434]
MHLQVTNSPFTNEQAELINKLLPTLTEAQLHWLGGYLAFYRTDQVSNTTALLTTSEVQDLPVAAVVTQGPREATILFGSQTGNSQRLAGRLANTLKGEGFEVTLSAMNQYKTNNLKKAGYLFVIVSTHGEGDPPDNALTFYEFLHSKRAPKLDGMKFSVLALGDTSYEFFCKTGQDFDSKLAELGAARIVDRVDCDVDFEDAASGWLAAINDAVTVATVSSSAAATPVSSAAISGDMSAPTSTAGDSAYSRTNPFKAEVLDNLNLNGRGSDRETRHLELSLEGSGMTYAPGDAVGVYAQNDPTLVNEVISAMKWSPEETVITGKNGEASTLYDALLHHYEITVLTKPLLEKAAAYSSSGKLAELVKPEHKEELKAYINGRDLLDLLRDYAPWTLAPRDVGTLLRKLPPRLYSIASSLDAHPEEVHLTIRKVEYEAHGRNRKGVCSGHIAEHLKPGAQLPIFIQHNPNFKLPIHLDMPIIMVGPGTGVAPFRSFLEEREELGAVGKTWLFYGDRHFVTDFLYQTEWQRMLKEGILTKLDVAFSRDTEEKVYVQQRMLENGKEMYEWLQDGAHVYVCGDEKHMAHDVQAALLAIIEQHGGKSPEAAAQYLSELQEQGRYQRDVY